MRWGDLDVWQMDAVARDAKTGFLNGDPRIVPLPCTLGALKHGILVKFMQRGDRAQYRT